MRYEIKIRKLALKELSSLPVKTNKQIVEAIDILGDDPRPKGCKKLKGELEDMWRIRVGDYRIIYAIEDEIRIIDIRKIGHRKDFIN